MIEVKLLKDSIGCENDARLTTFVLTYPRFIHAEFMTHRVFSRNASSSRAIPIDKVIQQVIENPAMPVQWGRNQKGMQAEVIFSGDEAFRCERAWLAARDAAVIEARRLQALGLHKQIVNRVLEPFAHITVIVTATHWKNFFRLRCHKDAQPEIHQLADMMYAEYIHSVPNVLDVGDWHLPFIDIPADEILPENLERFKVQSVAACARVSYLNHDGTAPNYEKDEALYKHLVESDPPHMTPAEHQAMYIGDGLMHANFKSFASLRKYIPNEAGE